MLGQTALIFLGALICKAQIPPLFHVGFKFNCPEGFLQNDTDCLLTKKASICPELPQLNTTYTINTKKINKTWIDNSKYCRYRRDDFFAIRTKNNSATLMLTFQNKRTPFELILDVNATYPIYEMEKKIYCWAYATTDRLLLKKIKINTIFNDKRIGRYSLEIKDKLRLYTCCLLDPGKSKAAITNRVMASTRAKYIFKTQMLQCWYTLQMKHKDNFLSLEINDTHDDVFGASNISNLQEALHDFKKELSLTCHDTVSKVTNNQFCLPITTGDTKVTRWPETPVGLFAFSNDFCFGIGGKSLRRQCVQEEFDARWANIKENCSDITAPRETVQLVDIQRQNLTEISLTNVSEILTRSPEINEYDINVVADILLHSSKVLNVSGYSAFFKTLDVVQRVDENTLNTSHSFGSTQKILEGAETFVERLVRERKNVSITYPNIACTIKSAFIQTSPGYQKSLDVTTKNEATGNITVQIKLSEELLTSFHSTNKSELDLTIAMVTYNTKRLFPHHKIENKIVDVMIYHGKEQLRRFEKPLSLFFNTNATKVLCVFWDIVRENWSLIDVKTTYVNKSTVECQTYHLTRFTLLIIDEKFAMDRNVIFMIICTVEATCSLIAVGAILIIAITSKDWAKKRTKTVHLSFIIVLEITLLFMAEFTPAATNQSYCTCLGVALHYVVLVKFTLTLLIAKIQLENFVHVFASVKRQVACFSSSEIFTVWVIPLFGVVTACVLSLDKYKAGEQNFCYPKEQIFYFFLVMPVALILLINLFVYTWILIKVFSTRKTKKNVILQYQLAVMLWFMLGITWALGVLTNMCSGTLQLFLKYTYSLIAPLQGVAIFLFSVLFDRSANLCCGLKNK